MSSKAEYVPMKYSPNLWQNKMANPTVDPRYGTCTPPSESARTVTE